MRLLRHSPALLTALFLQSCAGPQAGQPEIGANPFGPTGIPPQLRGNLDEGGTPVEAGGNTAAAAAALAAYNPDELVWTDPDNPDAEIPQLQGLMAVATQSGPWNESDTDARRRSKVSGKPMVIWFTDSSPRCPACKSLSNGLFSREDFEDWAADNVVRLIVDLGVKGEDIDDDARKKSYVRGLKKKYNVRGLPTLLVLAPSGEVVGRYKSYRKGQEDFIWGQLKQGVTLASENHKSWKAGLEGKGYRDWSDGKGRAIFAKLAAYREGEVVLVEPDGQRARTHEDRLSAGDRVWIQQQKELRGIR